MAGKFGLFKDVGCKLRFRLKAGNGQLNASSEASGTKAAAQNGIKSVEQRADGKDRLSDLSDVTTVRPRVSVAG